MKKIVLSIITLTSLGCCIYQAASVFFDWTPTGKVEIVAGLVQLFMSNAIFLLMAILLRSITINKTI